MQEVPLSVAQILHHGSTAHSDTTVITWRPDGPDTTTFATIAARAGAFANVLQDHYGITGDQRISTLMSNCAEHLEVMFAVMCKGTVFHPLNWNLSDDQLIHVINYSNDQIVIVSPHLAARLARVLGKCPSVRGVIVCSGSPSEKQDALRILRNSPNVAGRPDGVEDYEALLDGHSTLFDWPELPETDGAAMCYSTGTEGAPKGVVYSHRSLWLHSEALRATDTFGITQGSSFLCGAPIYHVLSWGVPLAAFLSGAPIIFPGRNLSAPRIAEIIGTSMPRMAHGVPTLWISLMSHYMDHPPERMSLREIFAGGAPVPPRLIELWEERFGVDLIQCWGMTETSPLGTVARPPAGVSGGKRWALQSSQGRFYPAVQYRIVDENGKALVRHDRNQGELQVRGNWVTASYYQRPDTPADSGNDSAPTATNDADGTSDHVSNDIDSSQAPAVPREFRGKPLEFAENKFTDDGWLRTGDVGSVTKEGFLLIKDRARDVIRSGGEWIYSAELENYIMGAPNVKECAVIGYPDENWGERPLAIVTPTEGTPHTRETAEELRDFLRKDVPSWMLPEYWAFLRHIDKTSVQKYDKLDLRAHLADGDLEVIALQGPRRTSPQNPQPENLSVE